jgi:hypothetical protein
MAPAHRTYSGVLHVHTIDKDGQPDIEAVLKAARSEQADFVVLTDHGNAHHNNPELEGWHDDVLILCGEEVNTPEGHLLAFETRETVGTQDSLDKALEFIEQFSGSAVSIHHQLYEIEDRPLPFLPPPLEFEKAGLVEIWAFMDEFLARTSSRYILQALRHPDKLVHGPSRRLLWKWDRELEKRMLPMVGGLNVRPRKDPLLEWKTLFPYPDAFCTLRTCIQTQHLPTINRRACDMVWNALREGRSYIANVSVAQDKGFYFEYHESDGRIRRMGDDVPYSTDGRFFINVPEEAELVLRHNGQPFFWGTAREISFPPAGPGSYRVEVFLNRRMWILSNPIRLVDDDGAIQPTVSDVT